MDDIAFDNLGMPCDIGRGIGQMKVSHEKLIRRKSNKPYVSLGILH